MNPIAIIQARMGSTRLPGKVLLRLGDKTVLEHVVERVRRTRGVKEVLVATTVHPEDKLIVQLCARRSIPLYIGSAEDVLDRYYQAARLYRANPVIRITADCPLIDPKVIRLVLSTHFRGGVDLTGNTNPPTFPDGQDVEVFRFAALERAWRLARLQSQREHVTPYIKDHPAAFRLRNVCHSEDLSSLRWTLDEKDDLLFLRDVYRALGRRGVVFGMGDVLSFLKKNPAIAKINAHIPRNLGYLRSLRHDRVVNKEL